MKDGRIPVTWRHCYHTFPPPPLYPDLYFDGDNLNLNTRIIIILYFFTGTELCTVVESMFSFETLFSIQGDPMFAERAEKLTYNALPATITSDMWAHQYLQQPNEMNAIHSDDHIWRFDGPDSTL